MTLDEARAILSLGSEQLFKVEDVAEAVGLAPTTVRNWINRGHVEMLHTILTGKGSRAYFAYYDVITIMIVAEFSLLGIKPQDVREHLAMLNSLVTRKIQEEAGVWGEGHDYRELERYAVLYHSKAEKESLQLYLPPSSGKIFESAPYDKFFSTTIVVDCLDIAERAMKLFSTLPRAK